MRRTFPNKNLKPTYEVLFAGNDLDNHHIASRLLQGQMQKHPKLFPGIVDYDPDLSPVLILDKAKHQRGTGKALHDTLNPIMEKYGLTEQSDLVSKYKMLELLKDLAKGYKEVGYPDAAEVFKMWCIQMQMP